MSLPQRLLIELPFDLHSIDIELLKLTKLESDAYSLVQVILQEFSIVGAPRSHSLGLFIERLMLANYNTEVEQDATNISGKMAILGEQINQQLTTLLGHDQGVPIELEGINGKNIMLYLGS